MEPVVVVAVAVAVSMLEAVSVSSNDGAVVVIEPSGPAVLDGMAGRFCVVKSDSSCRAYRS